MRREERLQQREDRLSTKNADLKAEVGRLREALKTVTVNLIACHSLLGAGGKIAAASDKMFKIMMSDYAKAIEVGRSTAWPETRAALQPKEVEW